MTVCVAAISQQIIVGASDRMLTSGDIEFEPPISKLHELTKRVCIMLAGDISLQAEILHVVTQEVQNYSDRDWKVSELADVYYGAFEQIRRTRAERAILRPLGLSLAALVTLQSEIAIRLSSDILNFQVPEIEALVTGTDDNGPHIYQVNNYGTACQDWVAFASIGVGATHANSLIMFTGHNRQRLIAETMYLVYSAKKRAEVAPGVGHATDMFIIEPGDEKEYYPVGSFIIDEFEIAYQEMELATKAAREHADGRAHGFIKEIIAAGSQAKLPAPSDSGVAEITPGNYESYATASEEPI